MAVSRFSMTFRDYSKELSSMRLNVALIDATTIAATETATDALLAAVQGITLGIAAKKILTVYDTALSALAPTNKAAQRETKWLVRYEDNSTHEVFRGEIPCADTSLLSNNSDFINTFPSGVLGTFKSAFEAAIVSEEGNPVTVISLEYVGKRL